MLSKDKRRAIAARAVQILSLDTVEWIQGNWIIDPAELGKDSHDRETDVTRTGTMALVRNRINDYGYGNSCGVCLEGALLLSMAQDSEIDGDWEAYELLQEFQADVLELDLSVWGVPEGRANPIEIPELNDDYIGEKEEAIRVLEAMANS